MRKSVSMGVALVLAVAALAFAGCSAEQEAPSPPAIPESQEAAPSQDAVQEDGGSQDAASGNVPQSEAGAALRISAAFDGREVVVELLDNPTALDLYARLSMELSFSDYSQTEKIAYPPEPLVTEGSPSSCDPAPGDMALYAPWGNLSFFYEDFRFSEGLVPIGSAVSGAEHLAEMADGQSVLLDRVE